MAPAKRFPPLAAILPLQPTRSIVEDTGGRTIAVVRYNRNLPSRYPTNAGGKTVGE